MNHLTNNTQLQHVKRSLVQHAVILGGLVALLWLLEVADLLIWHGGLDQFGITPRSYSGLRNIVIAPFLHAGLGHLFANTIPLLILGWFVLLRGNREFVVVTFIAGAVSGLGIWLFGGANTVHIGYSGILFGYLGYLLYRGYLERSVAAIALALAALLLFGGMVWGILPLRAGVSWLGHLFGLLGGVLAATVITDRNRKGGR